jgi:hypothetical protein
MSLDEGFLEHARRTQSDAFVIELARDQLPPSIDLAREGQRRCYAPSGDDSVSGPNRVCGMVGFRRDR